MTPKPAIAAVGAGRMGRGLAQVFAYAGHAVALIDIKQRDPKDFARLADAARAEIRASLETLAALDVLGRDTIDRIMGRITVHSRDDADPALARADIVFEGVPETIEAKRDALARIGGAARPDAIVASATSTMRVDMLGDLIARPERFLNAHWLNPAFIIPLVEISPGPATAPEVLETLKALLETIGKVPVVCAPSPGFIVPRLQALVMNEAARMVEEGVATAEEIDRATRYGLGFRFATLGVVEFIDWGGGDILYYADRYLSEALNAPRFQAPNIVSEKMAAGETGLRAGKGFYDYGDRDIAAYRSDTLARFIGLLRHYDLLKPPAPD